MTAKRYKWLATHFPAGSDAIKAKKALINNVAAHANIVSTEQTFRISEVGDTVDAPFFDLEDEYHVKADLWLASSIAIELMDVLYGVNRGRNVIEFAPGFLAYMAGAIRTNADLHSEMTSTERYKKAMEKMQRRVTTKSS